MRIQTISTALAVAISLVGCGKQSTSSSNPPSPANERVSTTAAAPVAQPALSAWQQGDKSTAVSSFVAANWNARPIFVSGSVLSLTEDQFKSLSDADRQARSAEMTKQLDSLKQLGAAVAQAGRDAAAKGDTAQAQKYFTSLKQCGTALSSPECLTLVQLVGKTLNKMADTDSAKIAR